MITILGAGGAIGNELVKLLVARKEPFRLVGRNPKAGFRRDRNTGRRSHGSGRGHSRRCRLHRCHLVVGLKYDYKVWQEAWPRVMRNTIEGCKRAGARLVFFDNVYMYGKVSGPMTEATPFNPVQQER